MRNLYNSPIEYSAQRRGYYYSEPSYDLPALKLNEGELVAIFLAEKVLAQYRRTPYFEQISKAFEKITALLPESITVDFTKIEKSVSFRNPVVTVQDIENFKKLAFAVLSRESVKIKYHTQYRNRLTERIFDPYHLLNLSGDWYAIGFCHMRKKVLTFLTARIKRITAMGIPFEVSNDFNISAYLSGAFRIIKDSGAGSGDITVRLRFDPWATRYIREKIWHESQKIQNLKDGSCILTLRLSSTIEVKSWILSWGEHVKVLEPEELVEEMRGTVKRMGRMYRLKKE
jgi:predicted DNA-binding transcriptional regulator YafY